MYCLRCGDCCKALSPIANPCSYLTYAGDVARCTIYGKRPEQCRNHDYPTHICPVGLGVLKLGYEAAISRLQQIEVMELGGKT